MSISFRCYYCSDTKWVKKEEYTDHMGHHQMMGDDFGTIAIPKSFDDYIKRLSAVGIINESDIKRG